MELRIDTCFALALVWLAACATPRSPEASEPPRATGAAPRVSSASDSTASGPSALDPLADARHLMNRFAFGPRPGELERVSRMGAERWLDAQLDGPEETPLLDPLLSPYRDALSAPVELVEGWLGEDWGEGKWSERQLGKKLKPFYRNHEAALASAELTRHIVSERQVQEVMVDFWVNHFNVYLRKGFVRVFAGDYVERAIRPHALGRFSDLLLATLRHPAMLLYLDNAESSVTPQTKRAKRRGRGLNENYARELLELHTLGVDGGYTQDDVVAVARILSGHGVTRVGTGRFEYAFQPKRHDFGEKVALGEVFAAGGGAEEATRLVEILAKHPATARHVSKKLCGRLVSDEPPAACVDAAARAFTASGGEIKAVLRAIVREPSFWSAEARGAKFKTPLELLVTTARSLGAVPDGSRGLARTLAALGEPVFGERVPTGYPEGEPEWASSGGMLTRLNFAVAVASGRFRGVRYDLEPLLPLSSSKEELVRRANALLLGGRASSKTLETVRAALEKEADPKERRRICLALLLGSPEFQRQ
jgi:uncharacterized protein (DUF1800 family)